MKDNMLEVGDKIALYTTTGFPSMMLTVNRVTKMMAMATNKTNDVEIKFKREVQYNTLSKEHTAYRVGTNVWDRSRAIVVTPETKERIERDGEIAIMNKKIRKWLETHSSVRQFTVEEKEVLIKTFNL